MVIGTKFVRKGNAKARFESGTHEQEGSERCRQVLRNPKSSKAAKTAAASALTQRPNTK